MNTILVLVLKLVFFYKKSFKDNLSSLSIGGTFDLKTKLTGTGTLKETHNLDSETVRDIKYTIGNTIFLRNMVLV